jgi:hypothetical protein
MGRHHRPDGTWSAHCAKSPGSTPTSTTRCHALLHRMLRHRPHPSEPAGSHP